MTDPANTPYRLTHHGIMERIRPMLGLRWRVGDRLPPVRQLAAELGAGRISTLRAVRELAAEGLLVSKRRLGTVVVRRGVAAESDVSAGRTDDLASKSVLISVTAVLDAFGRVAADGVISRLKELGVRVEVVNPYLDDISVENLLHAEDFDAVVAINPPLDKAIRALGTQNLAVISTQASVNVAMPGRFDVVSVDSEQGGVLAGRWMRRVQPGEVAFLGVKLHAAATGRYDLTSELRLRGFERGWGGALPERCLYTGHRYTIDDGADLFRVWFDTPDRPRGLFAATDELAVGFVIAARGRGLEPGRDFHIIGFDGQWRGRCLAAGPLTTVEVPMYEMGQAAADLIAERFRNPGRSPRHVSVSCRMLEGKTAVPAVDSSPMHIRAIRETSHAK